jgi:hypothetical protein
VAVKLALALLLLGSAQAGTVHLNAGQTLVVTCSSDALRIDREAPHMGLAVTVRCYADVAPPLPPGVERTAR